jgi:hypothetical protein
MKSLDSSQGQLPMSPANSAALSDLGALVDAHLQRQSAEHDVPSSDLHASCCAVRSPEAARPRGATGSIRATNTLLRQVQQPCISIWVSSHRRDPIRSPGEFVFTVEEEAFMKRSLWQRCILSFLRTSAKSLQAEVVEGPPRSSPAST